MSSGEEEPLSDRVKSMLDSYGRVDEHAGEQSPEGVQTDLANLRAAVRELHQVVVLLAEKLDKRQ